jgi:hypothetical protein
VSSSDFPAVPPVPGTMPAPAGVPPEPKPNAFQRIVGAVIAPTATFASIARRPDFLVILVLYIVLGFASAMLMMQHVDFESGIREQMASSNKNMKEEDLDRVVRFSSAFAKGAMYASPVLGVAIYAIIAGVLLLAFRAMGGEGTFLQAFSTTLYAWVPMLIKSVLAVVILMTRGSVDLQQLNNLVMSNLSFLVDMKEQPVVYALLTSLDLFTIWTLALMIIGFSYVAKVTRTRSAAIILSIWGVVVFAKLGMAALSGLGAKRT